MTQLAQVGLGGGIPPVLLILAIVLTFVYALGAYLITKGILSEKSKTKGIIFILLGASLLLLPFYDYKTKKEEYQIEIDLREPDNFTQLPENTKWFPMETYEFTAIQGRVTAKIVLPDGTDLNDIFDIVYIDRDQDGIFRVKADSFEWLSPEDTIALLDNQIEWISKTDLEEKRTEVIRPEIVEWLRTWRYSSGNRRSIWARSGRAYLICEYSTLSGPDRGFRYGVTYKLDRPQERIKNIYPQNKSVVTTPDAARPPS